MIEVPMSPKGGVTASLAITLLVAWMDFITGLELEFSAF